METEILTIINGDPKLEPVILLSSRFEQLNDIEDKKNFVNVLKDLISTGTKKEILTSLYILSFINKAKECESEIKKIIEKFDIIFDEELISPLLGLCAQLSTDWSINFIKTITKKFKPDTRIRSLYFDTGLRKIISTFYWKDSISDIEWAIENYDDVQFVDFVAFFLYQQGKCGLKELLAIVNNNQFVEKIKKLNSNIIDRYSNNYAKISALV